MTQPRICLVAAAWLAALAAFSPATVAGQRTIELSATDATAAQPFSLVHGARELADGRLIVADYIEQRIALIDVAAGTVTDRGRVGAGPDEFRLPDRLLPFRGDSTLLIDMGNGRLAVLDGEGRIRRTFTPSVPSAVYPTGADARGRLYFVVPAWRAQPPLAGDSVEFAVWDPSDDRVRKLATLHGSTSVQGPAPEMRIPFVVFAPQDAVAVSTSGRVVIVRDRDYHVDSIENGVVRAGPSHAYRPIRASPAERTAFARSFAMSSPIGGREGGLTHAPAELVSEEAVARLVRASTFAETLPFFRAGAVFLDAADQLWVGRSTRAGEARVYDVLDRDGSLLARVRLRPDREILTVGRHVWIAFTNRDGLQILERYAMPSFDS